MRTIILAFGLLSFVLMLTGCVECASDDDCDETSFCFSGRCTSAEAAEMCEDTGGVLSTMICCCASENFPNLCVVGACSCPPSLECTKVVYCACPEGECWNGVEDGCVTREELLLLRE